ncbi:MAG: lipid II flippase MurJ [Planctomycetota bacterium]|nr:lipid II flippase MurJ [Planctomycetota bacterium]
MTEPRKYRTGFHLVAVTSASLLQILNQFLFFAVNARLWGADARTDSLQFAIALPVVLATIMTGSLSYVLVPQLVAKFENPKEERAAWRLASFVGLVTLVVSGGISLLLYLFALPIAEALMEQKQAGQHSAAGGFLRILSWQVIFFGMISWAQAVLHSQHQFAVAAFAGVIGTAAQLVTVLCFGDRSLEVIAWAINLGSVLSLLIHLIPIVPKLGFPSAGVVGLGSLLASLWPLVLGAAFLRLDPMLDRIFASELDQGSLTHISWAHRIHAALLALGASSLSLVALPQLAEFYSKDGIKGFSTHFALCTRRISLLIIPVAIGVSVFSVWIIRDLLEGGKILPSDSQRVGWLVTGFMGLFLGASLAELISRGFYVLGDTKTPTLIGVICLVVGLVVKYLLFQQIGVWGIALGISLYYSVTATVLGWALLKRSSREIFTGCAVYVAQAGLAAGFACGCCFIIYSSNFITALLPATWVAAPIGAFSYFIALLALKNEEAWRCWRTINSKMRTRDKSPVA